MTHAGTVCTPLVLSIGLLAGCGGQAERAADTTFASEPGSPVEASCGQCQFALSGDGCDLAVRIDGTAYYVDGSGIDDHGDAHGADGLCNAIRKADVVGSVVDDRFVASSFILRPM
jgi:hypothetical protein